MLAVHELIVTRIMGLLLSMHALSALPAKLSMHPVICQVETATLMLLTAAVGSQCVRNTVQGTSGYLTTVWLTKARASQVMLTPPLLSEVATAVWESGHCCSNLSGNHIIILT